MFALQSQSSANVLYYRSAEITVFEEDPYLSKYSIHNLCLGAAELKSCLWRHFVLYVLLRRNKRLIDYHHGEQHLIVYCDYVLSVHMI